MRADFRFAASEGTVLPPTVYDAAYADYYRRVAPVFDYIRLDQSEDLAITVRTTEKWLRGGKPILDIGCGTGRYTERLIAAGYAAIGIDLSRAQLFYAPPHVPRVIADARALPFGSNLFSACLFFLSIHQISGGDLSRVLNEASRVLAPGGHIVIKTFSHNDLRRRAFDEFFPSALPINLQRYPDIPELEARLRDAQFYQTAVEPLFSEETISGSDLVKRTLAKHNTTLALIPDPEFQAGCKRLASVYGKAESLRVPHFYTLVVGKKKRTRRF